MARRIAARSCAARIGLFTAPPSSRASRWASGVVELASLPGTAAVFDAAQADPLGLGHEVAVQLGSRRAAARRAQR